MHFQMKNVFGADCLSTAHKTRTKRFLFGNESGVILVYVALLLFVLLGIASLAVDVGYLMVVRNELQNAADAAALAGASSLYPQIPAAPYTPQWDTAEAQAANAIQLNRSDGDNLITGEVQSGYWNIDHSAPAWQANTAIPRPRDYPAVRVTVRKTAGINNGPVVNWFARSMGINTTDMSAQATAAMVSPGSADPGALLPIAISQVMAANRNLYTCPNLFRIGSSYHYPSTEAGQWTTFELGANSASDIQNLITHGNPDALNIGDSIWVGPGTKASDYKYIPVDTDVLVPVVQDITAKTWQPVLGFACFHITDSNQGKKYIEGCFNGNCYAGNTHNTGPEYGSGRPSLVQ